MKKFMLRVFVICLVVFQIWNIAILLNPPVKSEMVRYGTIENSGEYDGMIIRDEYVIIADASGVLESEAGENDVVKKGKHIASVYAGSVDPDTQAKLKQINARIAEISGSQADNLIFENDKAKIESHISTRISDMIISINNKNLRRISELKNDLNVLMAKKLEISGESGSMATLLNDLKNEKERYERQLSTSKQNLYAPRAGIYSTVIDGFEQILSGESLKVMTVDDFKNIYDTEPKISDGAQAPVCKIVSNVEWYAAMSVPNDKASEMWVGQPVYIKIGENSEEYKAAVSYISPEDGKKCVVGVTATEYSQQAMKTRKEKITLITNKYNGIKIPIEAIRVNNGVQGVYTVTEGLMKFKTAEILHKDNKYAIVKENTGDRGSVLLYDEVVIDAKEVGENIAVR